MLWRGLTGLVIRSSSDILRVKVIRAQTPSTHVVFPRDPSNRNFKTVSLFKTVQTSYIKAFGVDKNYQSLGVMVVIYTLGVLKALMEGMIVYTLEVAHLFKIGSSGSLLRVKSDEYQLVPPPNCSSFNQTYLVEIVRFLLFF